MILSAVEYLLTELAEIDGIGKLLDYYPVEPNTGLLAKEAFADQGVINLLIITRPTAEEQLEWQNAATYQHLMVLEYRLTYGGQASQRAFNAVIDSLLAALYNDESLGGTVEARGPVRLVQTQEQFFYKWLVHYGRIEFTVET